MRSIKEKKKLISANLKSELKTKIIINSKIMQKYANLHFIEMKSSSLVFLSIFK